jgi:5-formyltetrahydrofolate cyclo-ligase
VTAEPLEELAHRKTTLRTAVRALRHAQPEKDTLSAAIGRRLRALAEYQVASVIMFYLDARSEVRTRSVLRDALADHKQVAVPQCVGDELHAWRIAALDEVDVGAFGIAEPSTALRAKPERQVDPRTIDLVLVPGIAFDRRGGRLGSGRGYYDRFATQVRSDCMLIGLAYDCQIVDELPTAPHDVPMHIVVTPTHLIRP